MNKKLRQIPALPENTEVLTPNGYVLIQDIKKGDHVACWNTKENRASVQEVESTLIMEGNELIHIETNKGTITTAPKSILTMDDDTLMEAQYLLEFGIIQRMDNEISFILDIQKEQKNYRSYNIKLKKYNNFFISKQDILVEGIQEEFNFDEIIDPSMMMEIN